MFALNDYTSLDYASKRLGMSSMLSVSRSTRSMDDAARGASHETTTIQGTPLMSPEEVEYYFSRQSENQIIFYPGADPIFLKRTEYFRSPFFEGMW